MENIIKTIQKDLLENYSLEELSLMLAHQLFKKYKHQKGTMPPPRKGLKEIDLRFTQLAWETHRNRRKLNSSQIAGVNGVLSEYRRYHLSEIDFDEINRIYSKFVREHQGDISSVLLGKKQFRIPSEKISAITAAAMPGDDDDELFVTPTAEDDEVRNSATNSQMKNELETVLKQVENRLGRTKDPELRKGLAAEISIIKELQKVKITAKTDESTGALVVDVADQRITFGSLFSALTKTRLNLFAVEWSQLNLLWKALVVAFIDSLITATSASIDLIPSLVTAVKPYLLDSKLALYTCAIGATTFILYSVSGAVIDAFKTVPGIVKTKLEEGMRNILSAKFEGIVAAQVPSFVNILAYFVAYYLCSFLAGSPLTIVHNIFCQVAAGHFSNVIEKITYRK